MHHDLTRHRFSAALCLTIAGVLLAPTGYARLQDEAPRAAMPFSELDARIEGEEVRVVALGSAGEAEGPLAARRASARTAARARALTLLHRFVDDALARVSVTPAQLRDAHAAIDASADLRRVRSLVDGSVLVEVAVPLAPLRAAIAGGGLPW